MELKINGGWNLVRAWTEGSTVSVELRTIEGKSWVIEGLRFESAQRVEHQPRENYVGETGYGAKLTQMTQRVETRLCLVSDQVDVDEAVFEVARRRYR